jgi:hypothetical protein
MQRTVVLATSNYGILAAAFILWDETLPLFLKLDIDDGGFSFDSNGIGLLLSLRSATIHDDDDTFVAKE